MNFLDTILNTGLTAYQANQTAGATAAAANAQAQTAAAQAAQAKSSQTTLWLIIGGAVLAVVALVFAFRK